MERPLFAMVKGLRLVACGEVMEESKAGELREAEVRLFEKRREGLQAGVAPMLSQGSLDHVINIAV